MMMDTNRIVRCRYLYLLFLPLLFVSCMCSLEKSVQGQGEYSLVSVEAFADSISKPGVQLVDVRTPQEFEEGNIPGSVNIDVMTGHFGEDASKELDKAYTVAVYCRSGNRSKDAAKMLSLMGYNVVELDEGYNAWVESGR